MTRVTINGPLPEFDLTGFALIDSFELHSDLHPIVYAWFGRHCSERRCAPIVLLRYMLDAGILVSLKVTEAIVSYRVQKQVWFPETDVFDAKHDEKFAKYIGRIIIGKLTQRG